MIGEIISGYKGFTALLDTAKRVKDISDAATRQTITYELTAEILKAQEAQAALIQQVSSLKQDLMRFETWEAEKQRYELVDVKEGVFVYRLKAGVEPPEPPHDICASCYQQRKKSVLQNQHWQPFRAHVMVCNECDAVVYLSGHPHPDHQKIRRGR
jgi:hypothetical protein